MTRRDQLVHSTAVLAATAADQILYLEEFFKTKLADDANVDELALEFDDAFGLAPSLLQEGEITAYQFALASELDQLLSVASEMRPSEFWTPRLLRNDPGWEEIRIKARECLAALE